MKLLILCLISFFMSMTIAQAEQPIQVVVFDFGGVIAQANTTQMSNFLINSFNINKDELSSALREMQNYVSNGGSEKQFWEQFAISKKITLPNDWFNQFGIVIKQSISEIPETLTIVKTLQSQGYQTAMLSDVTFASPRPTLKFSNAMGERTFLKPESAKRPTLPTSIKKG